MDNKFLTYFPERFVVNRSYIKKAIKQFINADFENIVEPYHDLRNFIKQPIAEWNQNYIPEELFIKRDIANSKLSAIPIEKRMNSEELKEWSKINQEIKELIKVYPRLEEETEITKSIIGFYKAGRNIFSISPFLTNLLNHTDVGNVRFEDVKLPYNSIFLHFGPLYDIRLPIDSFEYKHNIENLLQDKEIEYLLDGAFISIIREHSLDIRLTFIDPKENFEKNQSIIKDFRFPTVNFTLEFQKWDKEARTSKLDKNVTFAESTVCFSDIWDSKSQPSELEYDKIHALTKEPEKCYESEWEEYVLFDNALKLIVNSLCYLNYIKDDKEISTTEDHATQIIQELESTKQKQKRNKLFDKLNKYSYSKIHFFGKNIENEYKITKNGIELNTHWRRGHWRNQAHGVGMKKHRLTWIKPTIVRGDKGDPGYGHIYDV